MPKNVTLKRMGEVIYPETKWENIIDKPITFDKWLDEGVSYFNLSEEVREAIRKANTALQKSDLSDIEAVIPSTANSQNQLADKNFVNSSIATSTSTYRGAYNVVTNLGLTNIATQSEISNALSGVVYPKDNNDYVFIQIPTSDASPNEIIRIDRYKYNGTSWLFEYTVNNSGFTSEQWNAINSGITSLLVEKLWNLPTNPELTVLLNRKQDVINDLSDIRSGAQSGSTAYHKSPNGIPVEDLSEDIQASLEKANTAVQLEPGKGLSTNDFTDNDKKKLNLVDNSVVVSISEQYSGGELSDYIITVKRFSTITGQTLTNNFYLSDLFTMHGVQYVLQPLTPEQQAQARSNIGAADYSSVPDLLSDLSDVTGAPSNGQALVYDATSQTWKPTSISTINGQSLFDGGDIVITGGGSGPAIVQLEKLVYYGGSNTNISLGTSLSNLFNSDESPITDVLCDTKYYYISIPVNDTLEKVITENNENITDLFILKGQYQQDGESYNLYEFHLSSDVPLNANINITISE